MSLRHWLDQIQDSEIRVFTEFALSCAPDYFWSISASTSGKHHGKGETLVEHVEACCCLGQKVVGQFRGVWRSLQADQLFSALILHDLWRCGYPGKEERFTEEYVAAQGLPASLIGELKTSKLHPEIGAEMLNSVYWAQRKPPVATKHSHFDAIFDAVRHHYGPFGTSDQSKALLTLSFDSVILQVHNIDFMQTMMAQIATRRSEY